MQMHTLFSCDPARFGLKLSGPADSPPRRSFVTLGLATMVLLAAAALLGVLLLLLRG